MGLEITQVTSDRDLETFLRVPALLRPENHANKTPGRWMRPLFDRRRNPYFRHADHALLLARREGRLVGRVAVFVDHLCNRTLGEQAGSFGLFDCIDSPRVAARILEAAERWLGEHHVTEVRGPLGPAMRMGTGLLVEGHGQTPMPGMTFDPPELGPLIESAGYEPHKDLHAHKLNTAALPLAVTRSADAARARPGLVLHPFRISLFDTETSKITDVINALPGLGRTCAPWTDAEVRWMAMKMWAVADPFLVLLVEEGGEPAAVGLALRNVREVLGGRSPRSSWRDSWQVAKAMRLHQLRSARIMLLAVRPRDDGDASRTADLTALLLTELLGRLRLMGVRWAEVSLVDPTDALLLQLLGASGAEVYKTYRIYEKTLSLDEAGTATSTRPPPWS